MDDKKELTPRERFDLYDKERNELEEKYQFYLIAKPFVDDDGLLKANITAVPRESIDTKNGKVKN